MVLWNPCERKEQSLSFDLFKAFDRMDNSHISDLFSLKILIPFHVCATCSGLPSTVSTMILPSAIYLYSVILYNKFSQVLSAIFVNIDIFRFLQFNLHTTNSPLPLSLSNSLSLSRPPSLSLAISHTFHRHKRCIKQGQMGQTWKYIFVWIFRKNMNCSPPPKKNIYIYIINIESEKVVLNDSFIFLNI